MPEKHDLIKLFLQKQTSTLQNISDDIEKILKIVDILIDARDNRKKIFTLGNGGSGSTASHFVSDLLKTSITEGDNRFMAISLVDNVPVTLAWANDISYEDIFVEQLKNFISKDDVLVGFSGSGKSKNVTKAMNFAKQNGVTCIGLTGIPGGDFPNVSDVCLIVPSDDMLTIESTHLTICHCIVNAIRNMGTPKFTYD